MPRKPIPAWIETSRTHFHAGNRLVTWHPHGILDDELLDEIAYFALTLERIADAPFNRFTDLSGLSHIRLKIGHIFEVAEERKSLHAGMPPVKSAFYCDKVVGIGIARMYETLMEGASLEVRAFRDRIAAADWFGSAAEHSCRNRRQGIGNCVCQAISPNSMLHEPGTAGERESGGEPKSGKPRGAIFVSRRSSYWWRWFFLSSSDRFSRIEEAAPSPKPFCSQPSWWPPCRRARPLPVTSGRGWAGRFGDHGKMDQSLSAGFCPGHFVSARVAGVCGIYNCESVGSVLCAKTVDTEVLCASISAYLMLGLLWAFAYMLAARLTPGAFAFSVAQDARVPLHGSNAIYFSFVTLSTLGYGDITPVSHVARMLAMTEAMTGCLYVAVLIARLVALYSVPSPSD